MIEQALRARLIAAAPVSALIEERIYPVQTEFDAKFPAVVYQVTATEDPSPLVEGTPSGWWLSEITYQAVAERYMDAQAVGSAILANLTAVRNSTEFGAVVAYVNVTSTSDDEQDRQGTGPLYLRTLTFQTLYKPTA